MKFKTKTMYLVVEPTVLGGAALPRAEMYMAFKTKAWAQEYIRIQKENNVMFGYYGYIRTVEVEL